jgi:hypothetical protein
MKQSSARCLVFIALILVIIEVHAPAVRAQKVLIGPVIAPSKIYQGFPFTVVVPLHANQEGGSIKIELSVQGILLDSAQSDPILNPVGSHDVNLTVSTTALAASAKPHQLTLTAYWVALLGTTPEDSRTLEVEVVNVIFGEDHSPRTVQSGSSFTLNVSLRNDGNGIAYAARAELTDAAGFAVATSKSVALGKLRPGDVAVIHFGLNSTLTDWGQGERNIVLIVAFDDWQGLPHSQTLKLNIYYVLSQAMLNYWIPIIVILVVVAVVILKYARRILLGPVQIILRKR